MKFVSHLFSLYCINLCIPFPTNHDVQAADTPGVKTGNRRKEPTKTAITTSRQWIQESLETHNFFRSLHKTPPLVLNDTLSAVSQYYADHLMKLTMDTLDSQGRFSVYFEHNPEAHAAGIGENLYYTTMTSSVVQTIPSHYAVLLWYEEIKDYDFNTTKRKPTSASDAKIGHLTQLLWKETTQMGTAYSTRKLQKNQFITFVVANYYQAGNARGWKNFYSENVLPPVISEADVNAAIVSRNIEGWWEKLEIKSDTPKSWRKAWLNIHNKYREAHGSQPLRLNKDICKVSQNWADYLLERGLQAFNRIGVVNQIEKNFIGARLVGLGESSLFLITEEGKLSPEVPLNLWYKQRENYNFDGAQRKDNFKTDEFQQIVWNSTTAFCMSFASGKAENGQYLTYVVANYYPAITFVARDRKNNVFPSHKNPLDEPNKLDPYPLDKADPGEGCCSTGTITEIIFGVILAISAIVGGFIYLYKYKYGSYQTILKVVRIRKY